MIVLIINTLHILNRFFIRVIPLVKDNSLVFSVDPKKTVVLIPILMPDPFNHALFAEVGAQTNHFYEK
jgi:hypothetical protein